MFLDVEHLSDVISLSVEEYRHKTMEKIFRSLQVKVINVRGLLKKKLSIYLKR